MQTYPCCFEFLDTLKTMSCQDANFVVIGSPEVVMMTVMTKFDNYPFSVQITQYQYCQDSCLSVKSKAIFWKEVWSEFETGLLDLSVWHIVNNLTYHEIVCVMNIAM